MQKLVGFSCALVLLTAGAVLGADTHDSLLKEMLGTMKNAVTVLKGVKDEATAKEALPKVKKICEEMSDQKKRMDKLGKPTKEQDKELQKKYRGEMEQGFKAFTEEMLRVMKVPGGEELINQFKPSK